MDTDIRVNSQHPHVVQQFVQRKPSLTSNSSTERCVICLGEVLDQCEAKPCRHDNFDFGCLATWLHQRATCPLCGSEVHEVHYELSEHENPRKVYKVPKSSGEPDNSNENTDEYRPTQPQLPYEIEAVQRRRSVYSRDLYSLHVGSNRRQPSDLAYREISPQLFREDPLLISRARMWIRRELRVFEFRNTAANLRDHREPDDTEYLLEYIVAILRQMDIQGCAGQAENVIRGFLGRKYTRLFLHELKAWLRSPYETLGEWDNSIQYNDENAPAELSQTIRREPLEGINIRLKHSEPAEARKPHPSQDWRLYVFKGDDALDVIKLGDRSVWLFGRDERIVDVVTPHPSCSGQHAALQFRYVVGEVKKRDKREPIPDKDRVRLYLIDLDSTNSTSLNGLCIGNGRYVEIKHKDVVKFGESNREYVAILPPG
ncbi:MAG: hypothetical protein M1820_001122 [Bogoriella megaspora]|nr:MAG: hypothetical protein M1820_001122 [Bogoriella megaspora]